MRHDMRRRRGSRCSGPCIRGRWASPAGLGVSGFLPSGVGWAISRRAWARSKGVVGRLGRWGGWGSDRVCEGLSLWHFMQSAPSGLVRRTLVRLPPVHDSTCSLPGPWHFSHWTPSQDRERVVLLPVLGVGRGGMTAQAERRLPRFDRHAADGGNRAGLRRGQAGVGPRVLRVQPERGLLAGVLAVVARSRRPWHPRRPHAWAGP